MSIQFKVVKIVPPTIKEEDSHCYYPRITRRKKKNIRDIAKSISLSSTHSTADVVGVLEAFINELSFCLSDNCSIELGDLGTFSLHIHSKGAKTPKDVNPKNIKGVRMAFRPSTRMKKELSDLHFSKADK